LTYSEHILILRLQWCGEQTPTKKAEWFYSVYLHTEKNMGPFPCDGNRLVVTGPRN